MRILSLTLSLFLIFSIPVWGLIEYGPLTPTFGGFRIGSSEYASSLSHQYTPGLFYTISPLDDVVIDPSGIEYKYALRLDQSEIQQSWLKIASSNLKRDWNLLRNNTVRYLFEDEDGTAQIEYTFQVNDSELEITRVFEMENQEIIGIGRSLVFNTNDYLVVDGVPEYRPSSIEEAQLVIKSGVSEIMFLNEQLPEGLKLTTQPSDRIIIDWRFNVLIVKSFFSEPVLGRYEDTQQIVIIPIH